jgi:hypothetical protein
MEGEHGNVNCLLDDKIESHSSTTNRKNEGSFDSRPIEPECETKTFPLDPMVPKKMMMIPNM